MAAGSIIVDLLMRTGSFESDTKRAEKRLQAFEKQVAQTATAIAVGFTAAVGLAVAAFDTLVKQASEFQDLAEMTGASAESLASFAVSAATAGVSMESVSGAMVKLTKGLTGVDDESKAAGAAIAALGLDVADFKKLDPAAQYEQVGKALAGFADGAGKTAVALALFGKSGAEQLKVFKALEEAGGRQTILTEEQIRLADDYADRQAKSRVQLQLYAQAAATQALPALNDLTTAFKETIAQMVGVSTETGKLKADNGIKEFAESAADALAFVIDAFDGVKRAVQVTGLVLAATAAQVDVALSSSLGSISGNMKDLQDQAKADIAAVLDVPLFSERLKQARLKTAADAAALAGFVGPMPQKPKLAFEGAEKKDKKAPITEAQRYLETIEKQGETLLQLTDYERVLVELRSGRVAGLTPALEKSILAQAEFNRTLKQELEFRDGQVLLTTKIARAQLDSVEAITKSNVALREEIDLIGLDQIGVIGVEKARTSNTRALKESELARRAEAGAADETLRALEAEIAALREREELLGKKIGRSLEERSLEASKKSGEAIKDTLGDSIEAGILDGFRRGSSFTDIFLNELKAQFAKTILRPIIQPIADAGNKAIGDIIGAIGGFIGSGSGFSGNGSGSTPGGSLVGSGLGAGRARGGDVHANQEYWVGEEGPERFRPSTSGRVIPSDQSMGGGGRTNITIENHGARIEKRTDGNGDVRLIIDAAVAEVDRRIASGTGSTSAALKARGVNLSGNLPRRK
jgi:hypothetical protein